jgi:16S rRNA processing protein RimM
VFNPDSETLFSLDEIMVRRGQDEESIVPIRSIRPASNGILLLAFENVHDRNEAETFRGATLLVPREVLPATEDGEFYVHDILGAAVVGTDGASYGKVVDYITYPSTDVFVVQGERRYEVPVVDDFVRSVDPVRKVVTVEGIDGFETT